MTASNGLVDFHCHLDLYPDHAKAVQESEAAEVFTLAVTTTPKAWPRNHELAQGTRYVRAALGLHPQLVAERASELPIWEAHLSETRYVGEVGLDAGPRFYKSFELQKQVFEQVLRCCAKAGDKIITVHSIRAAKSVLDHIEAYLRPDQGKVVLHWFTGSKTEARRAIDLGCYFSVNAAMLDNDRHSSLVASLPIDKILTETDGPFTQAGVRPAKPSDVVVAVDALARVLCMPASTMAAIIRDNLHRLLASG